MILSCSHPHPHIKFYSPIFFSVFQAAVFHKILPPSASIINNMVVSRIRLRGKSHHLHFIQYNQVKQREDSCLQGSLHMPISLYRIPETFLKSCDKTNIKVHLDLQYR
jgi:hypothetical protein